MNELTQEQKEAERVRKYYDSNREQLDKERDEHLKQMNNPTGPSMRPAKHPSIQVIE